MSTDWRALCARMADELDNLQKCLDLEFGCGEEATAHPLADKARAALARWGGPAPAPAEERQAAPVPVAVSERSTQIEDLAADAVGALRYIEQTHGRLYGVGWDRVYEKADRLRPAHALPLPSGEVQP